MQFYVVLFADLLGILFIFHEWFCKMLKLEKNNGQMMVVFLGQQIVPRMVLNDC